MVLGTEGLPPRAALMQLIIGSWITHAIRAMAELDLADHLAAGPRAAVELAEATGTDAPTLPLARIEEAAHALNTHDAFIVPSEDGGYVLIGLRTPYEALFRDITWSTETVYRETVEKARRAGLSVHEGATHYDVDTPEDLARLKAELQEHPEQAPHTAELVKTL